ncbi:NB-ARC domain-containing protein [Streptomyces sp. CA-251387]|uniref:NB-ARC domain-containing protein n=1 Tax=Streptomyces sp. CA-251387 TaxID=3240064 RepID=UPI003D929350
MSGVFEGRPEVAASGDGSVAAGRDIGVAATGEGAIGTQIGQYIGSLTLQPVDTCPQPASVDSPLRLTNLRERPRLFVGRDRELAVLDAALTTPGEAVAHALHGLGGIGKSTLAAHWAAQQTAYAPVWWVTADSPAAIDDGLARLASALHPALAAHLPQERLSEWALQWLATHNDWLIVLDDVADPAHVKPLLARAPNGRFLITSRRATGWNDTAEPVSVEVLDEENAVRLFRRICPDAGPGVEAVCAELGCLPLAVHQAAAYCEESGATAEQYGALLAEYPDEMYATAAEGGDPQRTVARVWRITLDRLAADGPALPILLRLAWYASEGIPRAVLDSFGSPPVVHRAVARLAAHSMIKVHRATDTMSVHGLVQRVSRTVQPGDPYRTAEAVTDAREGATQALAKALPGGVRDPADWPGWRALLPHVEALAQYLPQGEESPTAARLLARAGEFAAVQGMRGHARRLTERAEQGLVRHLGSENIEVLTTRSLLIGIGDATVEEAVRHTDACERVLGARHPETITARFVLAEAYRRAKEYERAAETLQTVVLLRTQELGAGHRDTLLARAALSGSQAMLGDMRSAAHTLQSVHADCVRELGERDPVTLDLRGRLRSLASPGDLLLTLGPDFITALTHQSTDQMKDLVRRMGETVSPEVVQEWAEGQLAVAEAHFAECETVLGPGHEDTVYAKLHLAMLHGMKEDPTAALTHAREAVETATRYLQTGAPAAFMAQAVLAVVVALTAAPSPAALRELNEQLAQLQSLHVGTENELPGEGGR